MKHFIYFLKNISLLLCLFCGGVSAFSQSLVTIPNPAGHTVSQTDREDAQFFFQNKLLLRLTEQRQVGYIYKLGLFDGQNYTIVENPDNGQGYSGHPIIFRNELYVQYKSSTGVPQLAKLVGNRLVIIPNVPGYTYTGFPLVYKNRMYLNYNSGTSTYLAYFDGNSVSVTTDQIDDYYRTTIYKNKLYLTRNNKIIVVDSIAQSVFWENPNTTSLISNFTIHNDTLFILTSSNSKIFKTDGTNIQEVSPPNNVHSTYPYTTISLGNKLYIFYTVNNWGGPGILVEYNNGNTRTINKPDNGFGVIVNISKPVIFRDTLFFHYVDNQNKYQLAKLNGNVITFVGASEYEMSYYTYPTVFNENLYYGARLTSQPPKLLRYNGQRVTVISMPDSLLYIQPSKPIIFNNRLYVKTIRHLAVLEEEGGGSVSTQNIENDNIKIYPNPTNQLLNVVLEEEGQIGKMEIFNLLGQKVLSQNLTHQINQIPVENLSTGTYLANILIGEKVFHKTFIKQ